MGVCNTPLQANENTKITGDRFQTCLYGITLKYYLTNLEVETMVSQNAIPLKSC